MKPIPFFLTYLLILATAPALQAQRYMEWSKQINHNGKLGVSAIASHKDDIFVTGVFSDSLKLGSQSLISIGHEDIFLARFKRDGSLNWAAQTGGIENDRSTALLVAENQLFLAGSISDSAADKNENNLPARSLFVSAWDTTGLMLWQTSMPFHGTASLDMLAPGPANTLIAGGMLQGSIFFTEERSSGRANRAFVAQLSAQGEITGYAISTGSGQHRAVASARLQNDHFLVMFAATKGSFELVGPPNISLSHHMEEDGLLIVNFSPSFDKLWSVAIEGSGFVEGVQLLSDERNNIMAGLNFNGQLSCQGKHMLTDAQLSTALVRLDENGSLMGMQTITNSEYCRLKDMAITDEGDYLLTGYFSGPAVFGDIENQLGNRNVFIAQLSPNGATMWHDAFHLGNDHAGRAVSIGPEADVFIGGNFTPQLTYTNGKSSTLGLQNGLFVNRYKNCKPLPLVLLAPEMMCPQDTLLIEATPGYTTYIWDGFANIHNTLPVTGPGTYSVLIVDEYGCEGADTITIGTYPPTHFTFGGDVELTPGEYLELLVDSTYSTFDWSDNYQSRHRLVGYMENTGILELGLSVQAPGHCPAHDTLVVKFIENQSLKSFEIYPVPAGDMINWAWTGEEQTIYGISIVDTRGVVLHSENIGVSAAAYSGRISLASFHPGAYMLRLHTSTGITNRLIVKQ